MLLQLVPCQQLLLLLLQLAAVGRRETRERGNGEAAAAKVQARLAEEEITDAGERAEDLLRCSI